MKLQPTFLHPQSDGCPYFLSLLLRSAMHDDIIGISLEWQVRIFPPHPQIESIVQKQIRQQGTYHATLGCAFFTLDPLTILFLRRRFQPPLNIENRPLVLRVLPDCPVHQLMIDVVKIAFDV